MTKIDNNQIVPSFNVECGGCSHKLSNGSGYFSRRATYHPDKDTIFTKDSIIVSCDKCGYNQPLYPTLRQYRAWILYNSIGDICDDIFVFDEAFNKEWGNKDITIYYHAEDGIHFIPTADFKKMRRCDYTNRLPVNGNTLIEIYNRNGNVSYIHSDLDFELENNEYGHDKKHLESKTYDKNPFHRMVGIEFETVGGTPLNYLSFPKSVQNWVECHSDGSLQGSNYYGEEDDDNSDVNKIDYQQNGRGSNYELVSKPTNGDVLIDNIYALCGFLQSKGYKVNKSCGTHIHFDANNLTEETVKKIYIVFNVFEKALFDVLPPSRRKSNYCKKLRKDYNEVVAKPFRNYWYNDNRNFTFHIENKYHSSRYVSMNFHCFFRQGTVENRMHSGTLNPIKIINWMFINQILIDYAINNDLKTIIKLKGTFKQLVNIIQDYEKKYSCLIGYGLPEYLLARRQKFSNKEPVITPRDVLFNSDADEQKALFALRHIFENETFIY